jgi:hypothetical protein
MFQYAKISESPDSRVFLISFAFFPGEEVVKALPGSKVSLTAPDDPGYLTFLTQEFKDHLYENYLWLIRPP